VLRNESLAARAWHGTDFKFIGQRGERSNSGPHYYDLNTHIMFFAEMQQNQITCWNIKNDLKRSNMDVVEKNDATLIYPVDLEVRAETKEGPVNISSFSLQIDNENNLWVLSNRLPRFIYDRYDTNEYNFNIFRENVADAVAGTSCV